ncbi:hypothetical protein, variant 1 [Capsaspora owczarzaki ATCC 30864]|uniref:Uncharacterized protein n=1 Tax=Capsaspora owczarzaki (strain ATCC 30864) TaxID=595528 RepID=A0A0D2VQV2_CAPO3|nr:hypothetical protein, variant 1 [Capsaspora owczarzaki ATCC 30864]
MATRLERLLLLLDTGSTQATRRAAAGQVGEVLRYHPHELWSLLAKVQVFLRSRSWDTREAAGFALDAIARNVPLWDPVKAAQAIAQQAPTATHATATEQSQGDLEEATAETPTPMDTFEADDSKLSFVTFDLQRVLTRGRALLASVGSEYDVDLSGMDPRERLMMQRRNLQERLGLGRSNNDGDGEVDERRARLNSALPTGVESVITDEDLIAPVQRPKRKLEDGTEVDDSLGSSSNTTEVEELVGSAMSARQRNRLKRQSKSAVAISATTLDAAGAGSKRSSASTRAVVTDQAGNGDKIVLEAITDAHATLASADEWPFELLCDDLLNKLFAPAWEIRHGAGVGLREVLKTHGGQAGMSARATPEINERLRNQWLEDAAIRLICVFALDRFGDFVSDQVVAPVRETCAQTLGAILKFASPATVASVVDSVLVLAQQPQWETRHSALVSLKYAIAVRHDMAEQLLPRFLPAVLAGLQDLDDDVRAVAANSLLPICESVINYSDENDAGATIARVLSLLWESLLDLDDLSASTSSVINLLAELLGHSGVCLRVASGALVVDGRPQPPLHVLVPRLWPFLHHAMLSVRRATLRALEGLVEVSIQLHNDQHHDLAQFKNQEWAEDTSDDEQDAPPDNGSGATPMDLDVKPSQSRLAMCVAGASPAWWIIRRHRRTLRHLIQQLLLEKEATLLKDTLRVWHRLVRFALPIVVSATRSLQKLEALVLSWMTLAITPQGIALNYQDLLLPSIAQLQAQQQRQQQRQSVKMQSFESQANLPPPPPPLASPPPPGPVVKRPRKATAARAPAPAEPPSASSASIVASYYGQLLIGNISDRSIFDFAEVQRCRLAAFEAIAAVCRHWPSTALAGIESTLRGLLSSTSFARRVAAGAILAEWATFDTLDVPSSVVTTPPATLRPVLTQMLEEAGNTTSYVELTAFIEDMRTECGALLGTFAERGLPKESLSSAGDCRMYAPLHANELATTFFQAWTVHLDAFDTTVIQHHQAQISQLAAQVLTPMAAQQLRQLESQLRFKQQQIQRLVDQCISKRSRIQSAVAALEFNHERMHIKVLSALAFALIAMDPRPDKLNPIVRPLMDAVRKEQDEPLHWRAARGLAVLVDRCVDRTPSPNDKIVRAVAGMLAADAAHTPQLPTEGNPKQILDDWELGIVTARHQREADLADATAGGRGSSTAVSKAGDDDVAAAQAIAISSGAATSSSGADISAAIARDGAELVLRAASERFQNSIFSMLPRLWGLLSEPMIELFGPLDSPNLLLASATFDLAWSDASRALMDGSAKALERTREVLLSLQLLECLSTCLPQGAALDQIWTQLTGPTLSCLAYPNRAVRHLAARTVAALCCRFPVAAVQAVIFHVLPLLQDSTQITRRQGAAEALFHAIDRLGTDIVPFSVLLIVPLLGSMSDFDPDVRQLGTLTFAALLKLLPLEPGTPSPAGMHPALSARRTRDRHFLEQLMDPSKLDSYPVPVTIKAELRKYQQDGVNWLHFLNRYRLHGILCDDMGLGKTLQSICILSGDHFDRKQRRAAAAKSGGQAQADNFVPALATSFSDGTDSADATFARFERALESDHSHLPSLVVCPSTLIGHWFYEIRKFVDDSILQPLMYNGTRQERLEQQRQCARADVVIASYEIVRNDSDFFQQQQFNYVILDEGHIIKNPKSKITQAVKGIPSNHRLILSGTPIQNNVLELWSLFDFLMPGFLGTEKRFADVYSKPILASRGARSSSREQEAGTLALEGLHRQVLPFILRRMKEDVLHDLPPKIIQDLYCDLSPLQVRLFEHFSQSQGGELQQAVLRADEQATTAMDVDDDDNHDNGHEGPAKAKGNSKANASGGAKHIFEALQFLRQLCNHPSLVLQPKHPLYNSIRAELPQGTSISDYQQSPKLEALRQLLLDCGIGASAAGSAAAASATSTGRQTAAAASNAAEASVLEGAVSQHRALVFCQTKGMLDLITKQLLDAHMPTVSYLRLDGSIPPLERFAIVTKFNEDPSIDLLLLTTHVGGLGLNLTGADTVIFIDHDWNPSRDLQAMDRAHRIGQRKVVNVYRLITRGTLEEKIMSLQQFKLNIANTVITQENSSLRSMDTGQLLDLFTLPASAGASTSGLNPASAAGKSAAASAGVGGAASAVIESLGELWDDQQYASEYNVNDFLVSLEGGSRPASKRKTASSRK